jgi:transcriptional regulator with XRE-family HTH domain
MPKSFGERLKKVRIDRGLRQEDIGAIVHVGKSTVSQWENNIHVPDIETIVKIANYLNVTSDYLLGLSDNPTPIETIAAHRSDDPMSELPEEARKSLEEFKEFIFRKYGKGSG